MPTPISPVSVIPSVEPVPVVSVGPIVLPAPGRAVALQVRVSAPVTGRDLPIVLLSHGHGSSNNLSSLNGYGPLANYWAARGFVVIQPTHLSSATLRGVVDPNGPEGALFWRSRAEDMTRLLDALDAIEEAVPGLRGRVDRARVAVAGHSLGGMTAGMLLGQRVTDADGQVVELRDPRIVAGVIIAGPGNPTYLTGAARDRYPVLRTLDFSAMTAPALVVVGDRDVNPMFSDQAAYRAGAYTLSPGPKHLLTVFGGEHILGGISGYDAAETTDESPARVEAVAELTWAYLRTALNPADPTWPAACVALRDALSPLASVDAK
ncbi:alpha/beta fold hydrolase [Rhizobacter sp. Root404]|uniref:alpha/beta hydrolase family protein n=1 Tax=Rhizobacter sp. Root404 TaxID=1736528 RepID=UPI0006FF828A|nr:alpha/beta fold hydrolase [Rhizobacter sp. Root404]KQW38368.1 chlorophyllase [Rhizobacter sp. Root404]